MYCAVFIGCTTAVTCCHSLLFVVTRCHSLYYSLSFFITCCTTRCRSLSLVVILCYSLYHSSFVATHCTTCCHSLSLVVTRCTTRLSFYKRSHICRSSRLQMFFKIGALKNFAILRIKERLQRRCFPVRNSHMMLTYC